MDDNLLKYKIALEMIPHIGSVTAKRLISYCGGIEEVFNQSNQSLLKIPGIGQVLANAVNEQKVLDRAEKEVEFIIKYGITPLYYTDKLYPELLKQCEDSPVLLYSKGNYCLSEKKILAIVGTRNATEYGKKICEEIIKDLAQRGHDIVVISGLAHGIDSYAHRNSLKNGLPTIGVLAHGLDMIYPASNRGLAKEMLDNGGLITDFITGIQPERNNFLRRNRIIGGMAEATLVVESGFKGGALVTAEMALSYNRDVLACPGRVGDKYSEGCNKIIKQNKAALVESAEDIEKALNWENENQPVAVQQQLAFIREFTPDEKKIVEFIEKVGSESIDSISFNTDLSMPKTSALLLTLEFDGIVKCLPGKFYTLSK